MNRRTLIAALLCLLASPAHAVPPPVPGQRDPEPRDRAEPQRQLVRGRGLHGGGRWRALTEPVTWGSRARPRPDQSGGAAWR